jgi:Mn-dependent DtxR family transcriptional regulator
MSESGQEPMLTTRQLAAELGVSSFRVRQAAERLHLGTWVGTRRDGYTFNPDEAQRVRAAIWENLAWREHKGKR